MRKKHYVIPARLYLEAVRPHALDSNENITDYSLIAATCTVDGFTGVANATIRNYFVPYLTAYTTAQQSEYSDALQSKPIFSPATGVFQNYSFTELFYHDVSIEGHGYLKNPITILTDPVSYQYIRYDTATGHFYGSTTDGTALGIPNHSSSAKWKSNHGAASAISFNTTVFMPRLISAWLSYSSLDVTNRRAVDDQGEGESENPRERWLDIYIPYAAPGAQRTIDFGNRSWRDVISFIGSPISAIKAEFQ